jgi:hypothetical protein
MRAGRSQPFSRPPAATYRAGSLIALRRTSAAAPRPSPNRDALADVVRVRDYAVSLGDLSITNSITLCGKGREVELIEGPVTARR